MKLTTIKQQFQKKGISNVFRLKKLIQTAANDTNQQSQLKSGQKNCKDVNLLDDTSNFQCDFIRENKIRSIGDKKKRDPPSEDKQNAALDKSKNKFRKKNKSKHSNLKNSISVVCLQNSISKSISDRYEGYRRIGQQNNSNLLNTASQTGIKKTISCFGQLNLLKSGQQTKKQSIRLLNSKNKARSIKIIDAPIMSQRLKKCQSTHQLFQDKFRTLKNNSHILNTSQVKSGAQIVSLSCSSPSKLSQIGIQQSNTIKLSMKMFKIGKKLGRGRFGNVFLAQHRATGFICALKIVDKAQLKSSQMQQQLVSQLKLQMYMNHPNILKLYSFFDDQKNIYLILEIGQQCLFKQLRKKILLAEQQSAYLVKQIIQGFKYLHSQRIMHRDLKPQNIMIVNNVVKIGDFGWSIYSPLYKRNTFCGTLDYVSPQIVNGQFYDERVDIWGLGVLIYQLNVGKAPFQGHCSEEETFDRIRQVKYQVPERMSVQLSQLIESILHKNPTERINLSQIQNSAWIKSYERQGRSILPDIWNFWENSP